MSLKLYGSVSISVADEPELIIVQAKQFEDTGDDPRYIGDGEYATLYVYKYHDNHHDFDLEISATEYGNSVHECSPTLIDGNAEIVNDALRIVYVPHEES